MQEHTSHVKASRVEGQRPVTAWRGLQLGGMGLERRRCEVMCDKSLQHPAAGIVLVNAFGTLRCILQPRGVAAVAAVAAGALLISTACCRRVAASCAFVAPCEAVHGMCAYLLP